MKNWAYHNPVKIVFGNGSLDSLPKQVAGRSYILVTHPEQVLVPWIEDIEGLCGAPLLKVDDVPSNPSLQWLDRIAAYLSEMAVVPELYIALGGGSVIDTVKVLSASGGDYRNGMAALRSGTILPLKPIPILAIPTTAGTGSDVTKWATIWDTSAEAKMSLEREDLFPEATIIDPRLMKSLPWSATLASGLDAISHALESIWNSGANPISQGYAIRAMQSLQPALLKLQNDINDTGAREELAYGALLAGLAFSNTRTALAHSISYGITLKHGVPHGIACSFCLPEVMQSAIGCDSSCDAALQTIFGDLNAAHLKLRKFLDGLGVPRSFAAFGIDSNEWKMHVENAFAGARGKNFIGAFERFPLDATGFEVSGQGDDQD